MRTFTYAMGTLTLILGLSIVAAAQPLLVVDDVSIIDGSGASPKDGMTLVVRDGRFVAIGRSVDVPPDAEHIDGTGKYAIPGLMDMHVHLRGGIRSLHGYLYSGVTTIYDAGNDPDVIFPLRDDERRGEIVAPRIFATGRVVTVPEGHASAMGVTIEDFVRDREKLDEHIARNPDILKITQDEHGWGTRPLIRYMPVDLLEQIVRYYHEHGIPTTIHTSNELRTWEAIYAGVDSLAHPVIQAPVSERYLKMMGVKRIPQVSTLTIGDGYSRLVEHPEFLDQPLYQATMLQADIERMRTTTRREWEERRWTQWMKVMTPVAQDNLRRLHEAGGIVVVGTDQSLGPAVHRELELLVEGGIEPLDAIRMATLNGAVYLGREDELGTIEVGKLADFVLLDADPSVDIDNAKKINLVVKGGHVIDRAALELPANGVTE